MIVSSPHKIVQAGKQILGSLDIQLLCCDAFKKCNTVFLQALEPEYCKKFSEVFSQNQSFYYGIQKRNRDSLISYEYGIGKIKNKSILLRKRAISCSLDGKEEDYSDSFLNFYCNEEEGEFLVVFNGTPSHFEYLFVEPNSILACDKPHSIRNIDIKTNSIVGRLDKNITSIPIPSLLNQIIRYNDQTRCVEFFDGKRWIQLMERTSENTT